MDAKTLTNKVMPTVTDMIRMDHTHVLETFHQYEIQTAPKTKQALVNTIILALEIHAQLEEEIFYPAFSAVAGNEMVDEKNKPEHQEMRQLVAQLKNMKATDSEFDQTFMRLMRAVMHHVADEETVMLPKAELLLKDRLGELGLEMTKRRLQLAGPRAGEIAANSLRSMPASTMLLAAGAVLAGGYMLKHSQTRH